MSKFLVTILTVLLLCLSYAQKPKLLSVVVIYRHGMRAPTQTYKNDPYNNTRYWGVDLGQLINIGKMQHFELGKWFRNRYDGFLPRTYSNKDIKVVSSDRDRCLMSAEANLAGLYPPEGDQIWNKQILWQPIPVHTRPSDKDAILYQGRPCPKYDKLFQELLERDVFRKVLNDNEKVFNYMSEKSGEAIKTLSQFKKLINTIHVQSFFNVTLPDWVNILPGQIHCLAQLAWISYTYTPELARLKAGPLIHSIINHFENVLAKSQDYPKFLMYSAHDSTLVNIMNSMKIYDYHWPDFAATLIFELMTKDNQTSFVNILYKNATKLGRIKLNRCDNNCDFNEFKEILKPITVSMDVWERDCQSY